MKTITKSILLLSAVLFLLSSTVGCCVPVPSDDIEQTTPTEPEFTDTVPESTDTVPESTSAEATVPTTLPPHSPLYIQGLTAEDVILYFNEVCLDAEITNSGNPSVIQKWAEPLYCYTSGTMTDEDQLTLDRFIQQLNSIDGFPGICITQDLGQANTNIYFCDQAQLLNIMGNNFTGMDGAVTFWYEQDQIYKANICIRTDLTQTCRNSVIMEELYNALGPVQDTDLRTDSMIYAGYSEPQELTEIDLLLLQLLYHPDIKCGMNAEECANVIRQLYY